MASTRRWIIAASLGVAGFGVALIAFDSWRAYRRDVADAQRSSRNLATVLADHAARTVDAVDQALIAIGEHAQARELLAAGGGDAPQGWVAERAAALPQVAWLNVVDAGGRVIAATTVPASSVASAAERDYFRLAREAHGTERAVFGELRRGQSSGRWLLPMARAVSGADGAFAGAVVAAIDVRFFAEVYRSIDVGERGNVTLFRSDGTIAARWPDHDIYVGRSAAAGELFKHHVPVRPSGTIRTKTVFQDRDVLLSYRSIPKYPLVINAVYDMRDVLAGWSASLAVYLASIVGIASLTAVAALLVLRNLDRSRSLELMRQQAEDAHHARQMSEAEARAKSAFFSAMSHELRTPLNGIIGYCQMLRLGLGGAPDSPRHGEYLASIERSGQHLLETVNDILDLAKIAEGHSRLREEVVQVGALLADAVTIARGMGAGRVRDLVLGGNALELGVCADPLRLKQVVLNLVSNAIKVSGEEQVVTVAADIAPGGDLAISVRDEGPGMSGAEIEAAMQPWSRPDVAVQRSFARTGLGLSLSKALTELHGGRLEIVSTKNVGTTVHVWLPRERCVIRLAESSRPAA